MTARRDPARAEARERLRRWQALPAAERDRLTQLLHGPPTTDVSEAEQLELETTPDPEDPR